MSASDETYFLSFCIEQYKERNHLTGRDAVRLLDRYGILEYLSANYEVLHTQSNQWLMEEIEELLAERKGKER